MPEEVTMRYLLVFSLLGGVATAPAGQAQPPPRFDDAAQLVRYWFRSYYRRPAGPDEVRRIGDQLRRGDPPSYVLAGILASREYGTYAGGTSAGFITQLILDVGHRPATGREVSEHVGRLRRESRREVAEWFLRQYPKNWAPGLPASRPHRHDYWDR